MNTDLKKKINIAGTIGYVLSILLIICIITALVCTTLATVLCGVYIKDDVKISAVTNINAQTTGELFENIKDMLDKTTDLDTGEIISQSDGTAVFTVSDDEKQMDDFQIVQTENGVTINAVTKPKNISSGMLLGALITTIVYLATICALLYVLKALMKAFKGCQSPFEESVVKKLERFGYSLIPVIIMSTVFEAMWDRFVNGSGFDISLNFGGILIAVVVFILIIIFKYGAMLQKESDETL